MTASPSIGQNSGMTNPEAAEYPRDSSHDLEFVFSERNEAEYLGAIKHANRVRALKIILPIVGVLIILGLAAALVVRQMFLPEIDLGAIAVQDGKLVMENPNLNGFDKHKRPFSLSATQAVQDADSPRRVELIEIRATLPMDDDISASVSAGRGVYDAEAKTLILDRQISIQTTNGMRFDLEDADIDIGQGQLKTSNPVFASSSQADISADSLEVGESGEHVVFEGKSASF